MPWDRSIFPPFFYLSVFSFPTFLISAYLYTLTSCNSRMLHFIFHFIIYVLTFPLFQVFCFKTSICSPNLGYKILFQFIFSFAHSRIHFLFLQVYLITPLFFHPHPFVSPCCGLPFFFCWAVLNCLLISPFWASSNIVIFSFFHFFLFSLFSIK